MNDCAKSIELFSEKKTLGSPRKTTKPLFNANKLTTITVRYNCQALVVGGWWSAIR